MFCSRIEGRLGHPVIALEAVPEGAPLFSSEELSILRCTSDEHIMIANFTPKLRDLCREVGLEFVNTEEWRWIHVEHGAAENELKPDGSSSLPGLFLAKPLASTMADSRNPSGGFNFGQPFWKVRDMYFLWEFKCSISPSDRGKVYSYLSHVSHDDKINIYTCVLGDNKGFVCTTMQSGVVLTNESASWTMAGSRSFLLEQLRRFAVRNPWVSSLREVLCAAGVGGNRFSRQRLVREVLQGANPFWTHTSSQNCPHCIAEGSAACAYSCHERVQAPQQCSF